ncbi:MAG: cobalamin-dependent protein [Bacteroidetes bacterium]|nr:cobalamin-dependent protein [Bacteroidota bacterium]
MEQLGLAYLAAVARADGFTVEIIDGFLEPERYDARLAAMGPGDYMLIGYPVYQETVRRVAADVRALRERGLTTHVTVGNYLATLHGQRILEDYPEFDSAIRGEGEYAVTELLHALRGDRRPEDIPGLVHRAGGGIVANPPRPNAGDLDTIPFPSRDTLPLVLKAGNAPLIYSSRGCNACCEFCSVHKYYNASPGGRWRGRSPANVVNEIEFLMRTFGVTEFAFADEQFMGHGGSGRDRAIGIADEIIRRELKVRWYIETRSADVFPAVFGRMKEAGLASVFMGVESGYDPALRALRKGLLVLNHVQAIRTLLDLEILPSIGFIMFRPESTFDELRYNLDFLEEIGCGELTALATIAKVYTGTDLESRLLGEGMLQGDYRKYRWKFRDPGMNDCCTLFMENADLFSVMYNEFAEIRRSESLSFAECRSLQRFMNHAPIAILRDAVNTIEREAHCPDDLRSDVRTRLLDAAQEFLRLLRFTTAISEERVVDDGFRLLNPMALC